MLRCLVQKPDGETALGSRVLWSPLVSPTFSPEFAVTHRQSLTTLYHGTVLPAYQPSKKPVDHRDATGRLTVGRFSSMRPLSLRSKQ